ncbi:hypothetical protein [Rhodomicrobium lacus]|uniref:hypothetical protein n=1 Tax=Rhodomicrobium lacus TaxID=2498452 RepID=UPI0026E2687F|nr:hypothetical protein [Rhodomicrobium lacus]WKW49705.1 hypothetical protein QMO75_10375 [Rhodomicrobium lacus]
MPFPSIPYQRLSSGLWIRQNVSESVRPAFFWTGYEDWPYATHGGTILLVQFNHQVFGLTCRHIFGDGINRFEESNLFVPEVKLAKVGARNASIAEVCYPSSLKPDAIDTSISDLCLLRFSSDFGPSFFTCTAYVIDENTIATGFVGDELAVHGVLKEFTDFAVDPIEIGYCRLGFNDAGQLLHNPIARKAVAEYIKPPFSNLAGLSGAPVFNETKNALSGLVIKGRINERNECVIEYVDIYDIVKFLTAAERGDNDVFYRKSKPRPVTLKFGKDNLLGHAIVNWSWRTATVAQSNDSDTANHIIVDLDAPSKILSHQDLGRT